MTTELNGKWTSLRTVVDHAGVTINPDGTITLDVVQDGEDFIVKSAIHQPVQGAPITMSGKVFREGPNLTMLSLTEPDGTTYGGSFTKDPGIGRKVLAGMFQLPPIGPGELKSQTHRDDKFIQAQDNGVWVSTQP